MGYGSGGELIPFLVCGILLIVGVLIYAVVEDRRNNRHLDKLERELYVPERTVSTIRVLSQEEVAAQPEQRPFDQEGLDASS